MKLSDKDALRMKDFAAQWICGDLRPFSVIDDSGLRNRAQECIRIGETDGSDNQTKHSELPFNRSHVRICQCW